MRQIEDGFFGEKKKRIEIIMEIISFIVLILLFLVGYSTGPVSKGGRLLELNPQNDINFCVAFAGISGKGLDYEIFMRSLLMNLKGFSI